MSFSVSFKVTVPSGAAACASVDLEPGHDYETLVMEACSVISENGGGTFHIGGFGADAWPLDVAYDLSAFMEQFPSLLLGVRECREVEVDLYSQGIERTLTFHPNEDLVVIHCDSRTGWLPNPRCETIARSELMTMLSQLAGDFARGLKAVNVELSNIAPFEDWLRGKV